MSKTFEAWELIFSTKAFDPTQNLHFITATEIKSISGMEPRIMAKMDSTSDLPDVFKRNGYFLLPVKNGEYAIVRGNGFHTLEATNSASEHESRIKFHLSTAGRGSSEMQYLDYSIYSGALERVLGISPLYPSIRGREYSKAFSFNVGATKINTVSVQLEVDAGLEGEKDIVLIEAKIGNTKDFIIRQLFYPYRHFSVIESRKRIIPIFFTYDLETKIYTYWIYEFTNPDDYNSIQLKEVHSVTIRVSQELELAALTPRNVAYANDIPQADDLDRIIDLVFKVNEEYGYRDLATYFGIHTRQALYYRKAAITLGLVARKGLSSYVLTETGKQFTALPTDKRNIFMIELLKGFEPVGKSLEILDKDGSVNRTQITEIVASDAKISRSTVGRRVGTIEAWLKWMGDVTGNFSVQEKGVFSKN